MTATFFIIETAPQFDFRGTVFSHGWYMLAPCSWDEETGALSTIYRRASGAVLRLELSAPERRLRVDLPDLNRLGADLQPEIESLVRRMLSLDWDLRPFYAAMRGFAGYDWLEAEKRGRILVGGSLWEDLAKVLLTTNTTWAQTVQNCARLCQLGTPHPSLPGRHAFPSAGQIAALDFDVFAEALRGGYRNAYLYELAGRIANGGLDFDAWLSLDSEGLYAAVKSLKGFGDYAAGTIARMAGHFDRIAIDSACREMYAALHNDGVKSSDADIARHYAAFGQWRGLVMWMDIMRRHYVV
ncbi:MAG: 3-methyladenine DNA glycosylase [Chloroflexi bacterium]|nr:3-methyladenine DNA glycosylase [Chloroflexota bacterium]